jgi:hypothetical protein
MDRRSALKYLGAATASALILPSCVGDPKKVSVALNNLKITGDEEEMMGDLADVIIPATDTPGAKAVGAHHFVFVMVDDCHPEAEREKFLKGMRAFPDAVKSATDKKFSRSTPEERLEILNTLNKGGEKFPEEVRYFFDLSKQYIIRGYVTSQHFLTEIKQYQLVPGPNFQGCIPLTEKKTIS